MHTPAVLVVTIVAATAAFVAGTAIERSSAAESPHRDEAATAVHASGEPEASAEPAHSEAGGETGHAAERAAGGSETVTEAAHDELPPLGVDIEAWPFVMVATLLALGLAASAWLRPRAALMLAIVAVAMLAFAALDIREVVYQLDGKENALAAMAGAIALLHLGAAAVASVATRPARA